MSNTIIPFDLFKEACEEREYSRFSQVNNVLVLYTKNNVKAEIKSKHYTLGWLRTEDEIQTMKDRFIHAGYNLSTKRSDASKCVTVSFKNKKDILGEFWKLVDIIESIDSIVYRERGQAKKVFSREIAETNIFEKIAKTYKFAIENEHQLLLDQGRDLLEADTIDHILCRGESVSYDSQKGWREHVVPCVLIHNEAIRMIQDGSTVAEVAQMIATNLAIVRIHEDEARLLDVELGLRTNMPDGWKFGDSIFARLAFAGINLK